MEVKEAPVRGVRAVVGRLFGGKGKSRAKADKPTATGPDVSHVKVIETESPAAEAVKTEAVETGAIAAESAPQAASQTEAPEAEVAEPEAEVAEPETVVAQTEATQTKATQTKATQTKATQTKATRTKATQTKATQAKATQAKATQAAAPEAVAPQAPESAAADVALPLANYDTLTVASLRARLRPLNPGDLAVLIDYEKAHQGREEVIGMFQRRIVKIAAGETTSFQAIS